MSTRSTMGILNGDGTVTHIYVHFDGYPSARVPLLAHYVDEAKVRALMALGNLSSMDEEIGDEHDFEHRPDGVCAAYGRDRGEKGTEARVSPTFADFDAAARHDYAYLFRDGAWQGRGYRGAWMPVAELLASETAEQAE